MANENLGAARRAKNDEFYTQYHDIEKEINAYLDFDRDTFRDKTVLLPCDDPEWSNFTKFFAQNFESLGLRKLISTSYAPNSKPQEIVYQPTLFEFEDPKFDSGKTRSNGKIYILERDKNGDKKINFQDIEWKYLEGDGDFRSDEVKKLRDEADLIITNPPFSLFREFWEWTIDSKKKFAILGNMNAITYREVFPYMKDNLVWTGIKPFGGGMDMIMPRGSFDEEKAGLFSTNAEGQLVKNIMGVIWFTNIDHGRRHEAMPLMTMADNTKFSKHKEIKGTGYKKYDNFDAIEVPYLDSIPSDFEGLMGVPITFLSKYNPEQFEIIGSYNNGEHGEQLGAFKSEISVNGKKQLWNGPSIEGKPLYKRIVIRHRGNK